jgi:hypothetical protein
MEREGSKTRGEGKYTTKRIGTCCVCERGTVAGGADVESANVQRMLNWHVI